MRNNIIRALRLPFATASILPFIFGSLIERSSFNFINFILGLVCALAAHLSANLINDYADSKSGADWQDRKFYGFFGGSKLIQEGVLSEVFYFKLSAFFAALSFACVLLLSLRLRTFAIIVYYLCILLLAWAYSVRPFRFSYRRLGEPIIFLLFGPAAVMGGYFIQSAAFPDLKSFILSLAFGFLVAAILFVNEVPDFAQDLKAGKFTGVSLCGPERAYLCYLFLELAAFLSVLLSVCLGYLKPVSLIALILLVPVFKAASILKNHSRDKTRLIESSKLTIMVHSLTGIFLILSLFI